MKKLALFVAIITSVSFTTLTTAQKVSKCCKVGQVNKNIKNSKLSTNFNGQPISLIGNFIQVSESAPDFSLVKNDLSELKLSSLRGKNVILNIFPSLDTGVCATSVKEFNKRAAKLSNTVVLAISKDLPFAHGRFCTAEGINNVITLSDFRSHEFAKKYGLLIGDSPLKGLLARAVLVINPEGKITYFELVPEITTEPNYDAAINALK